jgi:LPS-assembly lipoprotein
MWLPDRLLKTVGAAAMAALAGCTAGPLYSSSVAPLAVAGAPAPTMSAVLGSVSVSEVRTRQAQEVRNELIFLLSGGRGSPVEAPYTLTLSASSASASSATTVITGVELAPTSAILTFTGAYVLRDSETQRIVGRGTRRATASYDVPLQPFAAQRAVRDAENRAARELAALLAAAVAADLATGRNAAEPEE